MLEDVADDVVVALVSVVGVVGVTGGGFAGGVTGGGTGFDVVSGAVGVPVGGVTGGTTEDEVDVVVVELSVGLVVDAPLPQPWANSTPASRLASNVNLNSRMCFIAPQDVDRR